jgi:hypothetical protein
MTWVKLRLPQSVYSIKRVDLSELIRQMESKHNVFLIDCRLNDWQIVNSNSSTHLQKKSKAEAVLKPSNPLNGTLRCTRT